MIKVMLRFNTDDPVLVRHLVEAWLQDQTVTLLHGNARESTETEIHPTYVKESEV